jgi:hypothetical protein
LKFGFRLGTIYVGNELLQNIGVLCEIGLVQRSKDEVGFYWSLEAGSYKIIGMSELEMNASKVFLTNGSNTIALQSPSLCKSKVEFGLGDVMLLSDSNTDTMDVVDVACPSASCVQVAPYVKVISTKALNRWDLSSQHVTSTTTSFLEVPIKFFILAILCLLLVNMLIKSISRNLYSWVISIYIVLV